MHYEKIRQLKINLNVCGKIILFFQITMEIQNICQSAVRSGCAFSFGYCIRFGATASNVELYAQ